MWRANLIVAIAGVAMFAAPGAMAQHSTFQQSCRNIQPRGPVLYALCLNRFNQWTETSLDLRTCDVRAISNRNGRLVCPGGRGSRSY